MRIALALSLLAVCASSASAQSTTLLVRTSAEAQPGVEAAVEDALRESVGGSVRRLDSPLDELALAAGCTDDSASSACIATIARAGGARLVAIERLERDGAEWRIRINLRRADGSQVSLMSARCDDASCTADALAADVDAETVDTASATDDDASPARVGHVDASPATSSGPSEPGVHSIPIVPHVFFVGALLTGIGAFIAGGVSLASANEATALGTLRNTAQVDRERSLEESSVVALGVGIALASCGAGLAIAGAITLAGNDGPRLRIGLLDVGLTVSF